ncbi:hypothetical protein MRB53_026410 [Persea americana]|uniref:Uncharacterized protein n=1 Tax=Persea americana TaxID=3435 RepID=A0ACC2LJ66_PERAE|nr:hypothetical protein MRB53_026410 [Persea americana]
MQRQLLEVSERRLAPVAQPAGAQFIFNNRGHDPNDLYERFWKRGPKEFTGQEDPLAADDWLEYTKNIYEISQCTGLADAEVWGNFKIQFSDKYVPTHVKRQKAIEFQQLVQGSMTVQEYLTKFERLSRYAPELIYTVEKKIAKFLEELNPIIERDATGVVPPATFEEAVRRAYKFENLNNKILKIQGKAPVHQQNHPPRNQQNKRPRQEQNVQNTLVCVHCGKNHESAQCRTITGACFRCGSMAHQLKDCPRLVGQGNRQNQQQQGAQRPTPPQNAPVVQNQPRPLQQQAPQQQYRPQQQQQQAR